jgi:hypothetical protein
MQTTIPGRDRDLLNRAYAIGLRLGRPFQPADVAADHTGTLAQAARHYAATYQGDFPLVREFANRLSCYGSLTLGQSKVVLNTMMNDARRALAARKPAPASATVAEAVASVDYQRIPKGRFTVVFDVENRDDRLTIEVVPWEDFTVRATGEVRDDVRSFRYLAGPDNSADYVFAAAIDARSIVIRGKNFGPRQQKALAILASASAAEIGKLGAAYSFEAGRCWRCNRVLTVEDSVSGGIGRTCAAKVGASYGGEMLAEARDAMARLKATRAVAEAPAGEVAPEPVAATIGNPSEAQTQRYGEIFGEAA